MQTYNSFNELAAAQTSGPLQSQMSVFNKVFDVESHSLIKQIKKTLVLLEANVQRSKRT